MCGIAGLLVGPGPGRDLLGSARRMADALAHRGPDDAGVWADPPRGVAFGFRRLAILDLSAAGHQPMVDPSGRCALVFNGEVYNFVELRRDLAARGVTFLGGSDTEVILHACMAWGPAEAVRRFRGMFAIAFWDGREECLWLARDRMGIKPLYVYRCGDTLAFASELKGIMALPGAGLELDERAAAAFLRELYVAGPRTILRQVSKVTPGSIVRFEGGDREGVVDHFWDLAGEARSAAGRPFVSEEEGVEAFESVFREAVRLRLRSDVPLGAFLSGGVDSSLVVAFAQELSAEPLQTFTVSFPEGGFDEAPRARRIADHLGTRHTEVEMEDSALLELVPELPVLFDEPLANPSQIPTVLVSRVARRHVTVALSGDGGDELFCGYNRYRLGARLLPLGGRLAGRLASRAAGRSAASAALGGGVRALSRLLGLGSQLDPTDQLHKLERVLAAGDDGGAYAELLAPGSLGPGAASVVIEEAYRRARAGGLSRMDAMMLADQLVYLPEDLLAKVDRASMSTSLEVRVPLLDQEVIRTAWRLPPAAKLRNGTSKWVLREALHRRVPPSLVQGPKMGFTVPIAAWLAGPLGDWATALVKDGREWGEGVPGPTTEALWERFRNGERRLALRVWANLTLLAWRRHWRL